MTVNILQMMPAEAGMYLLDPLTDHKATLVVMWVLAERFESVNQQKVLGLTVLDLQGDLADVLNDRWDAQNIYSTRVTSSTHKIIR